MNQEPKRYHEWILWKLKQENEMSEPFDEKVSLRVQVSDLKNTLANAENHIDLLKEEIASMNEEKYSLLNRIKELNDIRSAVIR